VENLHHWWSDAGTPARDRFGLTVTDAGEHQFWLDDPHDVWWTTDVARG
jgi:hypothetical protein